MAEPGREPKPEPEPEPELEPEPEPEQVPPAQGGLFTACCQDTDGGGIAAPPSPVPEPAPESATCSKIVHHNWFGPLLPVTERALVVQNLAAVAPLGSGWRCIVWMATDFNDPGAFEDNAAFIGSLSKRFQVSRLHPPHTLLHLHRTRAVRPLNVSGRTHRRSSCGWWRLTRRWRSLLTSWPCCGSYGPTASRSGGSGRSSR